jgi:hypothetical protein
MNQDSPKLAEQLSKLIDRKRRGSDVVTIGRKAAPPKSILPKHALVFYIIIIIIIIFF